MASKPLPQPAEVLRKQIKSMIPEARLQEEIGNPEAHVLNVDADGNKEYVGDILSHRVSALVQQLPIGEVSRRP